MSFRKKKFWWYIWFFFLRSYVGGFWTQPSYYRTAAKVASAPSLRQRTSAVDVAALSVVFVVACFFACLLFFAACLPAHVWAKASLIKKCFGLPYRTLNPALSLNSFWYIPKQNDFLTKRAVRGRSENLKYHLLRFFGIGAAQEYDVRGDWRRGGVGRSKMRGFPHASVITTRAPKVADRSTTVVKEK